MRPTPPIRFEVVAAPGEPNVYDVSAVLGEEPSEEDISAAVGAVFERLWAELHQRQDALSSPPTLLRWRPAKTWILHLYAVGQFPAKEQ